MQKAIRKDICMEDCFKYTGVVNGNNNNYRQTDRTQYYCKYSMKANTGVEFNCSKPCKTPNII